MPDEKGEILGEKTYILSEDGLKEISENGESFIKWIGVKSLEGMLLFSILPELKDFDPAGFIKDASLLSTFMAIRLFLWLFMCSYLP